MSFCEIPQSTKLSPSSHSLNKHCEPAGRALSFAQWSGCKRSRRPRGQPDEAICSWRDPQANTRNTCTRSSKALSAARQSNQKGERQTVRTSRSHETSRNCEQTPDTTTARSHTPHMDTLTTPHTPRTPARTAQHPQWAKQGHAEAHAPRPAKHTVTSHTSLPRLATHGRPGTNNANPAQQLPCRTTGTFTHHFLAAQAVLALHPRPRFRVRADSHARLSLVALFPTSTALTAWTRVFTSHRTRKRKRHQ